MISLELSLFPGNAPECFALFVWLLPFCADFFVDINQEKMVIFVKNRLVVKKRVNCSA